MGIARVLTAGTGLPLPWLSSSGGVTDSVRGGVMSGLDGLSSSSDSGADRGDRWGDREEDRPFPGAPLDRPPAPPLPEGTLSWDEIMADPATYEAALKEMHAGRDSYSGTLDALDPSWDASDSSDAADASHQSTADTAHEVREPSAPRPEEAEPERSDRAEQPSPAASAENVAEKERAGDNWADASGDDAEVLRQEIASLKADNAQQKAEIESVKSEVSGLKNEIAEIKSGLMHAHSEFHGEKLDLYTDGTRWRSGEALKEAEKKASEGGLQDLADVPEMRDQGNAVIGERPDDESDLPVSAEGMLEADEGESKLDRLRNKAVRNLSDTVGSSTNQADAIRNILNTPPTANAETLAKPDLGPAVDASPHASPTVDAVTQMAVVTLLVGYQVSGWARRKADEIRRRHDGSPG